MATKEVINKHLIESVKYHSNKHYPYIIHYKKGEIVKYLFGLFKKTREKDSYAIYSTRTGKYRDIEDIGAWLREHSNFCVDYFGEIKYKPYLIITMQSGEEHCCYFETKEEAERELEYIKNGREKFIELPKL